jgi:DNA-binding NtrC family response regulator
VPTALLVDDDRSSLAVMRKWMRRRGFEIRSAGTLAEAEKVLARTRPELVLLDLELPDGNGMELFRDAVDDAGSLVIVVSGTASVESAVDAMQSGALDVLTKPVDLDRLDGLLSKVRTELKLRARVGTLREQLRTMGRYGQLVGNSPPMQELYDLVAKVAPTETSVLVIGETGTGKEVVARTLHDESERSEGSFVPVNCGAIPENLIESELFGHEKGAFTGATDRRRGLFETATGGTLFLDEITEMPAELQVKLLRVLETRRIRRVGGDRAIAVDARIIAATNRDPEQAVEEGSLREDLLYRLMVFPLRVPPLRDRLDDVEQLARHFLEGLNHGAGKSVRLTDEALEELRSWDWPGNVRELKNVMERAFILAKDRIGAQDLPLEGRRRRRRSGSRSGLVNVGMSIRDAERELILATVRHHDGDKKAAADALGVCTKTLYTRLKRYRKDGFEV